MKASACPERQLFLRMELLLLHDVKCEDHREKSSKGEQLGPMYPAHIKLFTSTHISHSSHLHEITIAFIYAT